MIDPDNVINYNRTQDELEEFWLFCVLVAGKTAKTQAKLLDKLLNGNNKKPFSKIRRWIREDKLIDKLASVGTGQYSRLAKCFEESINAKINWRTVSVKELEQIHGVGPKTARFFVMMTQKNAQYAILDTHMLKYLKSIGYDVPTITPSGKKYREIEQLFIAEAKKSGKSIAQFDLDLWKKYSKKEV